MIKHKRIKHHGSRRTDETAKIRKDIRLNAASNKARAAKAVRYFDAIANELNLTNADLFTKMVEQYSQTTKFKPQRINFRKNKK